MRGGPAPTLLIISALLYPQTFNLVADAAHDEEEMKVDLDEKNVNSPQLSLDAEDATQFDLDKKNVNAQQLSLSSLDAEDATPKTPNGPGPDQGTCCCKAKIDKEQCTEKYDSSKPGYTKTERGNKFTVNWLVQLGPGEFDDNGGGCCVRFKVDSCAKIPSMTRFFSTYKNGWKEGKSCAARDESYGGSLDGKKVKIHWARHGQACHNVEQKYGAGPGGCWTSYVPPRGMNDPPLSNCGEFHSQKTGEATKVTFAGTGFFGSSSLLRTMQTAIAVFPDLKPIVPLPYVKERAGTFGIQSYCNTPEPGDSLTSQQAKVGMFGGKVSRIDTRYMKDSKLYHSTEDYDDFKTFFANTVLREFPAALNSAIVSHSHFITDFVLDDCGLKNKINNNEIWTVEYTVKRDSHRKLYLERDAGVNCTQLNPGVSTPQLCKSDWDSCRGMTPLEEITKKLKKVQDFINGGDFKNLNATEQGKYKNQCCVSPATNSPIVKHKKNKLDQSLAY